MKNFGIAVGIIFFIIISSIIYTICTPLTTLLSFSDNELWISVITTLKTKALPISREYGFVPNEHMGKSLKYLRHENGIDVYLNKVTGKEVYIGRTGKVEK